MSLSHMENTETNGPRFLQIWMTIYIWNETNNKTAKKQCCGNNNSNGGKTRRNSKSYMFNDVGTSMGTARNSHCLMLWLHFHVVGLLLVAGLLIAAPLRSLRLRQPKTNVQLRLTCTTKWFVITKIICFKSWWMSFMCFGRGFGMPWKRQLCIILLFFSFFVLN